MALIAGPTTFSDNRQTMRNNEDNGNDEETSTMINVASDTNAGGQQPQPTSRRFVIYRKPQSSGKNSKLCKGASGFTVLVIVVVLLLTLRNSGKRRRYYEIPEYKSVIETNFPRNIPSSNSEKYPEHPAKKPSNGKKYCSTLVCNDVAYSIKQAMDVYANPCTEFYQYACGGWIRQYSLPDGISSVDNFVLLSVNNTLTLRNLLEKYPRDERRAEDKARIYYASCIDETGVIEDLGSRPMLNLLDKIGGWSISKDFNISEWDFQKTLQALFNLPTAQKLFSWGVGVDLKTSSRNILQLDQGRLGLRDKENYQREKMFMMALFVKHMIKVGVLLGGDEESVRSHMIDIVLFETRLANIMADDTTNVELLYNKMKLSQLMEMAPAIDWIQYFNFAFRDANRKILPSDEIIVTSPEYIRDMSLLIEEYLSSTEDRIILSNYLGWSLVQGLISYLPDSFQFGSDILEKHASVSEARSWVSCVQNIQDTMGFVSGAMFVKYKFMGDIKQSVELMIKDIRDAFKQNLHSLKWLDDEAERLIKEKIDAIAVSVGYPSFIMDTGKLNKYYEKLELKRNVYFENSVRIKKFLVKKNMMKLDEPVNRLEWQMLTPSAVNAYYSPFRNQIVVPAGILQEPFYKTDYPKFLSFSRLGFLIGHELMHSVDNKGRLFDKSGNFHAWWKNSTIKNFEAQAQCFVRQYSQYQENSIHLNGTLTLPDNIADNGGLKTAFTAYENWMKNHSAELPLSYPFLRNLSPKQLFFVSFAQMWCAQTTSEEMDKSLREWTHSPHKFRVIGTLENSDAFTKEFNCPRSVLKNSKKCELW